MRSFCVAWSASTADWAMRPSPLVIAPTPCAAVFMFADIYRVTADW